MTVPTSTLQTYAAVGNREDLAELIHELNVADTPFYNALDMVSATSTKHEWQKFQLSSGSGSNANIEGDDATNDSALATTRCYNYTQILDKVAQVSGTQNAVNTAGRKNEMAWQILHQGKALKKDLEVTLLQNVAAAVGAATVPRKSAGAQAWMHSNIDKPADGTAPTGDGSDIYTAGTARALTETMLESVLASCWDNGGNPTMGITGKFQKRKIAGFAGSSTKTQDGASKKVINSVDVYVDPLGSEIRFVPTRQAPTTAVMLFDMEHVKLAVLRDFQTAELSKTGDSQRKQILVECTLEMGNEAAHGIVCDLTTS